MGTGVTTNHQLNAVGQKIFGTELSGVHSVDVKITQYMKKKSNGVIDQNPSYFIINVDGSNQPGSHWLAVYFDPRTQKFNIYDSFARGLKTLIPKFIKTIGYDYVNTNKKQDQPNNADDCGSRTISWLWAVKLHGIEKARHI